MIKSDLIYICQISKNTGLSDQQIHPAIRAASTFGKVTNITGLPKSVILPSNTEVPYIHRSVHTKRNEKR